MNSSGTYNFTGAGFISCPQMMIGAYGIGVFTQSAGTTSLATTNGPGQLVLANSSASQGTYSLSGTGTLSAATEIIGGSGSGDFNQSAGTNTVYSMLTIGASTATTSKGTYNLSGTGQLIVFNETLGPGKATFNQSGGVHQIVGTLNVGGSGSNNTSAYTLSGGLLSSSVLNIGYNSGSAVFVNSGGSHYVQNQLIVGYSGYSPTPCRYTLSGTGTLTVGGTAGITVGNSAPARFEWFNNGLSTPKLMIGSNGTLAMGFDFDLAALYNGSLYHGSAMPQNYLPTLEITNNATANQTGSINYPLGTLTIGSAAGAGTYNLTGTGTLMTSIENVGYSSNGVFNISSGINTMQGPGFYLGYNAGVQGTYNLTGTGILNASAEYIGYNGIGVFNQTTGNNNSNNNGEWALYLGYNSSATGTYTLSGTGHLTAGVEYIGNNGTGVFNQSDGFNTVNTLVLGINGKTNAAGTYNLSNSGALSASYEYVGGAASGTFNQSGGSNTVANTFCVGQQTGSAGVYNLSGGTLSAPAQYIGTNGGQAVFLQTGGNNSGTTLNIGNKGKYTLNGTGSISLNQASGQLVIAPVGRFEWFSGTLSTPVLSVNGGTLAMGFDFTMDSLFSGSLFNGIIANLNTTGILELTNGATASFSTGSSPSVNRLNLGSSTGSGNLDLSGDATLTVASASVGYSGSGTVTQTGGTFIATNPTLGLNLGNAAGANGVYNLNGGTLRLANLSAGPGTATFNFGGGTLQAIPSNVLHATLPMTLTGVGGNAKVDANTAIVTISGLISGPGGLDKLGNGGLYLTALNSYRGDTTVQGGVLEILGGIDPAGTKLIDIQDGTAEFATTNVNHPELVINISPAGAFGIQGGNHIIGSITGSGSMQIIAGSLTAKSIHLDRLVVGTPSPAQSVPEPSAILLLALGLIFAGAFRRMRKSI